MPFKKKGPQTFKKRTFSKITISSVLLCHTEPNYQNYVFFTQTMAFKQGGAKKIFFHLPLWRVNFQIYSPDQTSARHIGQLLLNPLANDANDKIRMYDSSTQLEIAPPFPLPIILKDFPKNLLVELILSYWTQKTNSKP